MQALKKVEANKGSCGVDGMETSELRAYFKSNPGKLYRANSSRYFLEKALRTASGT